MTTSSVPYVPVCEARRIKHTFEKLALTYRLSLERKCNRRAMIEYNYLGTETLCHGIRNNHVCRKRKCKVDCWLRITDEGSIPKCAYGPNS